MCVCVCVCVCVCGGGGERVGNKPIYRSDRDKSSYQYLPMTVKMLAKKAARCENPNSIIILKERDR